MTNHLPLMQMPLNVGYLTHVTQTMEMQSAFASGDIKILRWFARS